MVRGCAMVYVAGEGPGEACARGWGEEMEEKERGRREGKRGPGRSPGVRFLKRDFTPFPGPVCRFWWRF